MSDQGYGQQPGSYPPQLPDGAMTPTPQTPQPGTYPQPPPAQPQYPQPQSPDPQYPQPQYPQPQYPQPGGAPYGQAPQGQYGQPPAIPPAPKKRTGLIVGIIVGVLFLCALGGCAGLLLFASGSSSNSTDEATAKLAEKHYSAAMDAVDRADKSLTGVAGKTPAEVSVVVVSANRELRVGRDEIAAAKVAAEQLKESQGKTDYLVSVAAATKTLDAIQDMLVFMDTANGMAAKSAEAARLASAANDQLDYAVSRANGGSYGDMRRQALAASTNYTKAALLFREAAKLDPSAGLEKAAVYSDKRKAQADVVARMADEGKAGKVSAYNADIKRQAALGAQAKAAGVPAIVSDPNWGKSRLAVVTKTVEDAAKIADDQHAKALQELGLSK